MPKNLYSLEFRATTDQAQQSMEKMVALQKQYADSVRKTVQETLRLSDSDRITQKQITQVQKLMQLERQRAQEQIRQNRQRIMDDRTMTQEQRNNALQLLSIRERFNNARATISDNNFAGGTQMLLEQEAARFARQGGGAVSGLGATPPNYFGAAMSAAGGRMGGAAGGVLSALSKGGTMAKLGLVGLAAGGAVSLFKSLWSGGVERDKALQEVMAATQGRYQSTEGAISGSQTYMDVNAFAQWALLRNQSKHGATAVVENSKWFEKHGDSWYPSKQFMEAIDPMSVKHSGVVGFRDRYTGDWDKNASQAERDRHSAAGTQYNKDVNLFHSTGQGNELYYVYRAMKDAADAYRKNPTAVDAEAARRGVDKNVILREQAYEQYSSEIDRYKNQWGIVKAGRWTVGTQRDGLNDEGINKRYAAIIKEESIVKEQAKIATKNAETAEKNAKLAEEGKLAEVYSDRFTSLGISKTEALKIVAQTVQAMPNLRNPNEEAYRLALYSRTGIQQSEITGLNPYFDSGQNKTATQLFAMIRRGLNAPSDDYSAMRKYMEGYTQLLPQMLGSFATFNGNEAATLVETMSSIKDSFSKYGSNVFSGKFLGESIGSVNQSFSDRSNDWKETILYKANKDAWDYYAQNLSAADSIFNPDSKYYNAAIDLQRQSSPNFSWIANDMMRENGIFNNPRGIANVNKYLHEQFSNSDDLTAAVREVYSKASTQTAKLIADQIASGNYDLFNNTMGISSEDLNINPYTTSVQQNQAVMQDLVGDLGGKLLGLLTDVVDGITSIAEKIDSWIT